MPQFFQICVPSDKFELFYYISVWYTYLTRLSFTKKNLYFLFEYRIRLQYIPNTGFYYALCFTYSFNQRNLTPNKSIMYRKR